MLEVLGWGDDGESGDLAPGEQFGRYGERVVGLPGARRGDQEEVAPGQPEILVIGVLLPPSEAGKKIIPNGTVVRAHEAEMS